MKVKPIKRYKVPEYPDSEIVLEKPDILKSLPGRWKRNLCAGAALSTLLLITATACRSETIPDDKQTIVQSKSKNDAGDKSKMSLIAPIFKHGDGNGGFGCVSVAAPMFLSEEEALDIIIKTCKEYGLNFKKDNTVVKDLDIPNTHTFPKIILIDEEPTVKNSDNPNNPNNPNSPAIVKIDEKAIKKKQEQDVHRGDLVLDGYDHGYNIGFEYVSQDDFNSWVKPNGISASVESFNILGAAERLREGIHKGCKDKTIGVFYDPVTYTDTHGIMKQHEDEKLKDIKISDRGAYQLREQVIDFLNWLKAQGIL